METTPTPPNPGENLDPSQFQLVANSAQWTGRGDSTIPHHYTHPDSPGTEFEQAVIDVARENKRKADEAAAAARRASVSKIVASSPRETQSGQSEPRWKSFDAKDYVGVTPRTLESIIHHPRDKQLFGELILSLDPTMTGDLSEILKGEGLSDEKRQFLRYALYEFSKWIVRAEVVADRIDEQELELAAHRNPELELDTMWRGKDRVVAVLKDQTLKLAMRNTERFQQFEAAQSALHDDKSTARYQLWDARARSLCDQMGIEMKDYDAVFDTSRGNRAETRAQLQERAREKMGMFGKALDFTLGTVGISKADRAFKKADKLNIQNKKFWGSPTSWVVERINDNLNIVTDVMAETISKNSEIRDALVRGAVTLQEPEKNLAEDGGVQSFAEADRKVAEINSRPEVIKKWEAERKTAKKGDRGWNDWTPEERTQYRENWSPVDKAPEVRGKGFWACVFMAFVRAFWSPAEKQKHLSVENLPATA